MHAVELCWIGLEQSINTNSIANSTLQGLHACLLHSYKNTNFQQTCTHVLSYYYAISSYYYNNNTIYYNYEKCNVGLVYVYYIYMYY